MYQRFVYVLVTWACLLLRNRAGASTYETLKQLTEDILSSNYKPQLRPSENLSSPLDVRVSMALVSIQELDDINQSLTFSAFLDIRWTDFRLQWSLRAYNNTRFFVYPQLYLWLPDVTILNSVETITELGFPNNNVYVGRRGSLVWDLGRVFKTSCDIDVTYYPFDTQTCSVIFSTLVSRSTQVRLLPWHWPYDLDLYSPSGSWDLVSLSDGVFANHGVRSTVTFHITIRRRPTYYIITIIIPVLFLSLTATLVFALPADSGEKMGTSITVLLAFAVYLNIISDQMPQTSLHVSILSLYLSVLLGLTALGVVLSVSILNLHFRDDQRRPMGPRMRTMASLMRRLLRMPSRTVQVGPATQKPNNHQPNVSQTTPSALPTTCLAVSPSPSTEPLPPLPPPPQSLLPPPPPPPTQAEHTANAQSRSPPEKTPQECLSSTVEALTWKDAAHTIDRFMFCAFSLLLLSGTVLFLMVLVVGSSA